MRAARCTTAAATRLRLLSLVCASSNFLSNAHLASVQLGPDRLDHLLGHCFAAFGVEVDIFWLLQFFQLGQDEGVKIVYLDLVLVHDGEGGLVVLRGVFGKAQRGHACGVGRGGGENERGAGLLELLHQRFLEARLRIQRLLCRVAGNSLRND